MVKLFSHPGYWQSIIVRGIAGGLILTLIATYIGLQTSIPGSPVINLFTDGFIVGATIQFIVKTFNLS